MSVNKSGFSRLREFTRRWPFSKRDADPALSVSVATGIDKSESSEEHLGYGRVLALQPESRKKRKPRLHQPRKAGSDIND